MVTKQKILIVDDDENIAELISLYLTKECFDTMIVHDGEEALTAFESYQPNLMLLDLTLPELQAFSPVFSSDVYEAISLETCVRARDVTGGPAPRQVLASIEQGEAFLQSVKPL